MLNESFTFKGTHSPFCCEPEAYISDLGKYIYLYYSGDRRGVGLYIYCTKGKFSRVIIFENCYLVNDASVLYDTSYTTEKDGLQSSFRDGWLLWKHYCHLFISVKKKHLFNLFLKFWNVRFRISGKSLRNLFCMMDITGWNLQPHRTMFPVSHRV